VIRDAARPTARRLAEADDGLRRAHAAAFSVHREPPSGEPRCCLCVTVGMGIQKD
jgi:hypothetical protein